MRLESPNPDGRVVAGFVSVRAWIFQGKVPGSTDSTPHHTSKQRQQQQQQQLTDEKHEEDEDPRRRSHPHPHPHHRQHRRAQSLPPATQQPAVVPSHRSLTMIFASPCVRTYRYEDLRILL